MHIIHPFDDLREAEKFVTYLKVLRDESNLAVDIEHLASRRRARTLFV